SNGDKVKVQLKLEKGTSKEFKLKAKEFTKEFKVHGLKKPKELSAKDLIEGFNPKFTGVNGSGSLNLITKDVTKNLSNLSLSNYEFTRSDKHTTEIQSRFDLVCRLILEKIIIFNIYFLIYFN